MAPSSSPRAAPRLRTFHLQNLQADEVTFLNITGFRDCPLTDLPMLQVLVQASRNVFVPLTVGGGIRQFTDGQGVVHSALDVASAYFRAGADKISIGSDAVEAARALINGKSPDGSTAIEQISHVYGRQAVVTSIDPRRVWVGSKAEAKGHALVDHGAADVDAGVRGPKGERLCWYECTVQGGRKGSDIDVVQLAKAVETLGSGELLVNCIDCDGQNAGRGRRYDLPLLRSIKAAVKIPVIASSGAGAPEHFSTVFERTGVEAALAASIFHHKKVGIDEVKDHLQKRRISARRTAAPAAAAAGAGLAARSRSLVVTRWPAAVAVAAVLVVGVAILARPRR